MTPSPAQDDESRPEQGPATTYRHVRYASLPRRLGALLYDGVALAALWFGATALLLALVTGGEAVPPGNPWFTSFLTVVAAAYFLVSWRHGGQTLGMRAWKLVLVADDGRRPPPRALLARLGVGTMSLVCLGLGFFWALLRTDRRTWHDLASGTHLERLG